MINHYTINDDGEPQLEPDTLKWAEWFEHCDRRVLLDKLPNGVKVSTVFLGVDHNFDDDGLPILWETMIFGGTHDQYQARYRTKSDAIAGHVDALQLAKEDVCQSTSPKTR